MAAASMATVRWKLVSSDRLEAALATPAAVVVRPPQGGVEVVDAHLDAVLGKGDGVHGLPRGIRAHDRVADVEEDGPDGLSARAHLPAKPSGRAAQAALTPIVRRIE